VGLLTRLVCVPLLIDISLAIILTKLRELRAGGFMGVSGFWGMAHDARADWSMLFGLLFILIAGPSPMWSHSPSRRARRTLGARGGTPS
jgi:uncharacterized membrane protein YphA (DoxX/SURF4 family)